MSSKTLLLAAVFVLILGVGLFLFNPMLSADQPSQPQPTNPTHSPSLPNPPALGVPSGTIVAWYNKTAVDPPTGWVFCDGNNGTPKLNPARRFLRGTDTKEDVGVEDGAETHDHGGKVSTPPEGTDLPTSAKGDKVRNGGQHHIHNISSGSNLPPFVLVRWIMKI